MTVSKGFVAWGHVALTLQEYGADAIPVIAGFLRGFCLDGVATVLLRLPLADPATAALGDAFEALGFSICGVLPHAGPDDANLLIYQYLNNIAPETSGEQMAAGCRLLYDHVLAERRRVDLAVFGALPVVAR